MKTLNPFVPAVALISVPTRVDRRRRFKRTFIAVLAVHALVLFGLLASDWNRDLTVSARELPAGVAPLDGQAVALAATPSAGPATAARVNPATASRPAPAAANVPAAPTASRPETLYAVKSGDTLDDIAKKYATTPKALRAANGLATERLTVNQRLRIP